MLFAGERDHAGSGGPFVVAMWPALYGALLDARSDRTTSLPAAKRQDSVIIRASVTGIYWFFAVADELLPRGVIDPRALVEYLSPRFDSTWKAITSMTTALRCDGVLVDRDPLPRWGSGVVTLIGDAAHPMLPHTGQGAAQALVDAVTLGRMLRPDVNIESTLRRLRGGTAAEDGRPRGAGPPDGSFHADSEPDCLCYVRETALQPFPLKPLMKMYLRVNRSAGTDVDAV